MHNSYTIMLNASVTTTTDEEEVVDEENLQYRTNITFSSRCTGSGARTLRANIRNVGIQKGLGEFVNRFTTDNRITVSVWGGGGGGLHFRSDLLS